MSGRGIVSLLLLLLMGCSCTKQPPAAPGVAQALEGPPLALVAQYGTMKLEGTMERTCMVGLGKLQLAGKNAAGVPMFCEARINEKPSDKGRVRGVLDCTDGLVMLFSLRNLGPDQGVGLARSESDRSKTMVIFYHASKEEAQRRLPATVADMKKVMKP